jgi:2-succinyl-6-hydroxy-2,4-cyclohexadiene-1-carboxylate synthase
MAPISAGPPPSPRLAAQVESSSGSDRGRIVLVHGFTQTAACWSPIDTALTPGHQLVMVDAPGHGGSTDVELDLVDGGRAIAEVGGPGTYVGYSMGGRFVLHTALGHPDLVRRLVLISATAGIDDPDERAERRRSDAALADHLVEVGIRAFVDEWLRLPLFAGLPAERNHRSARLANTAAGLASSLRRAGTGTQAPLWDRLAELDMPVLVIAGADDAKFAGLAEAMVSAIGPNAELAVVAGAGHTVHLEQPDRFLAALHDWLDRTTA